MPNKLSPTIYDEIMAFNTVDGEVVMSTRAAGCSGIDQYYALVDAIDPETGENEQVFVPVYSDVREGDIYSFYDTADETVAMRTFMQRYDLVVFAGSNLSIGIIQFAKYDEQTGIYIIIPGFTIDFVYYGASGRPLKGGFIYDDKIWGYGCFQTQWSCSNYPYSRYGLFKWNESNQNYDFRQITSWPEYTNAEYMDLDTLFGPGPPWPRTKNINCIFTWNGDPDTDPIQETIVLNSLPGGKTGAAFPGWNWGAVGGGDFDNHYIYSSGGDNNYWPAVWKILAVDGTLYCLMQHVFSRWNPGGSPGTARTATYWTILKRDTLVGTYPGSWSYEGTEWGCVYVNDTELYETLGINRILPQTWVWWKDHFYCLGSEIIDAAGTRKNGLIRDDSNSIFYEVDVDEGIYLGQGFDSYADLVVTADYLYFGAGVINFDGFKIFRYDGTTFEDISPDFIDNSLYYYLLGMNVDTAGQVFICIGYRQPNNPSVVYPIFETIYIYKGNGNGAGWIKIHETYHVTGFRTYANTNYWVARFGYLNLQGFSPTSDRFYERSMRSQAYARHIIWDYYYGQDTPLESKYTDRLEFSELIDYGSDVLKQDPGYMTGLGFFSDGFEQTELTYVWNNPSENNEVTIYYQIPAPISLGQIYPAFASVLKSQAVIDNIDFTKTHNTGLFYTDPNSSNLDQYKGWPEDLV